MHPYQQDSYKTTFQAVVVAQQGSWVQLSETYFYPTSGGQLHDTGVLESATEHAEVGDVQLRDGGSGTGWKVNRLRSVPL